MAKVIAIVNQKGGVAKSTSCVNLGIGLVKKGYKVLAIDFDPQGSLTESLGYQNPDELEITVATILHCEMNGLELPEGYGILHHEEGMDILPANIELSGVEVSLVNVMSREYVLKQFIKTVSPEYDYILIDNMPSLGMLTVNALAAADSVIIPVMAHYLPVSVDLLIALVAVGAAAGGYYFKVYKPKHEYDDEDEMEEDEDESEDSESEKREVDDADEQEESTEPEILRDEDFDDNVLEDEEEEEGR